MVSLFNSVVLLFCFIGALIAYFGVRKFVVGVLDLYRRFRLFWLKIQGLTPENEIEARIVTGQAWEEYCDTLKAAGAALIHSGCPTDPFNQAEGYRYLSRLVRCSLENFMECADYQAPKLVAIANGDRDAPVKIGSDNPDNFYQSATISSRIAYRLKVKRGTVKYLGFGTQSGSYGAPGGLSTVDYKEAVEFEQDEDGNMEIIVSSERPKGCKNWLRTIYEVEAAMLIVRQTFNDHKNEVRAEVEIEKVEGQTLPTPVTCEKVDEALKKSGMLVGGASMMFARWANGFQQHENQLPLFDQETSNKVGGDPNIRYFHSYWRLADDECLVISATPPVVETWNFQLNNHWMESLDYRYYRIHVNMATAHYRKDKSIRIVIAHSDPAKIIKDENDTDAYDWINTVGHNCGTMCFRWIRPETDENLPHPKTEVVKFTDLPSIL